MVTYAVELVLLEEMCPGSLNPFNQEESMTTATATPTTVAPASAKALVTWDALSVHFAQSDARFSKSSVQYNGTKNLLMAYAVKHLDTSGNVKFAESFAKAFALDVKSTPARISQIRRLVDVFDVIGWVPLPTGNRDVTVSNGALVADAVRLVRTGDLGKILVNLTTAVKDGKTASQAIASAAEVKPKTPRKAKVEPTTTTDPTGTATDGPSEVALDETDEAPALNAAPTAQAVTDAIATALALLAKFEGEVDGFAAHLASGLVGASAGQREAIAVTLAKSVGKVLTTPVPVPTVAPKPMANDAATVRKAEALAQDAARKVREATLKGA